MTRLFTSNLSHIILFIGISIMVIPVWMIFASSTHTSSFINTHGLQFFLGDSFQENYLRVLMYQGGFFKEITALKMFFNSFVMATGVALLSVVTSLMAAAIREVTTDNNATPVAITKLLKNIFRAVISLKKPP